MSTVDQNKKPYVVSPLIKNIFDLFDQLRRECLEFGDFPMMLVTGETGSGKSELAKQYCERNPIRECEYRTRIPVFHYQIRSLSTKENMLRDILVLFGDPQGGKGAKNAAELLARFRVLSRSAGLELLIIDEVQSIIERRSSTVISGLGDLFKDLSIALEIPIVLIGMPWSKYLLEMNRQLKGRVAYQYHLPEFAISNNFENFKRMVMLLLRYYENENSDLLNSEYFIRMFCFTKGNVRSLTHLMRDVYKRRSDKNSAITLNNFTEVTRSYGVPDSENPFLMPISNIHLQEITVGSDWDFATKNRARSLVDAIYSSYGVTEDLTVYPVKHV